jgi:chorismate mutase
MNDEKKSPDTGQFDEGLNEGFDFGEGDTENRPLKITTKGRGLRVLWIIFALAIAVVLVMGYKIYQPKNIAKTDTPQNIPTITEQKIEPKIAEPTPAETAEIEQAFAAVTPPPPPVSITLPAESKPVLEPVIVAPAPLPAPQPDLKTPAEPIHTEASETTKLQDGLNKLNTQIDSILSQIKYLDAYSREVSDNLNRLNESISTMDTRILTLTNTTSTLSKDVGNVKNQVGQVRAVLKEDGLDVSDFAPKTKSHTQNKSEPLTTPEPEYTVHAVVPGRAWLKSTKGQIVTVAEGDTLGNYGKILVIDAANGVVLTSSGVAFR